MRVSKSWWIWCVQPESLPAPLSWLCTCQQGSSSIPSLLKLLLSIHSSWGGWRPGVHRPSFAALFTHSTGRNKALMAWSSAPFSELHTINAIPTEQQPGKSGRGQGNMKHSPSFLLIPVTVSHTLPTTGFTKPWGLPGVLLALCLVPSPKHEDKAWQPWECWSHQQNFPVKAGFPHGNECFSD